MYSVSIVNGEIQTWRTDSDTPFGLSENANYECLFCLTCTIKCRRLSIIHKSLQHELPMQHQLLLQLIVSWHLPHQHFWQN